MLFSNAESHFLSCQYLSEGPHNNLYKICDYCGINKKISILNQPIYCQRAGRESLYLIAGNAA
jgi:hypothetical protein